MSGRIEDARQLELPLEPPRSRPLPTHPPIRHVPVPTGDNS